jgi:hypothetical protein
MFAEQVLPTITEFNFNLTSLTRIINKEVSVNIKPIVSSLAKEFDRLIKDH